MPSVLVLIASVAAVLIAGLAARDELAVRLRLGLPVALGLSVAVASLLSAFGADANTAALTAACVLMCALIVETDRRHFLIPDRLTLTLAALAFLLPGDWQSPLLGAAIAGGLLLLVREAYKMLRGAHGLGLGDVKLAAAIGALLGAQTALVVVAIAAIATAILFARPTQPRTSAVPLGIGLASAAAIALIMRAGGWA
ncbi:leader peptidase [alpha proteobacterium U9-1i]|nr:leader peptidase [alpha proteobacterium U9-1i]